MDERILTAYRRARRQLNATKQAMQQAVDAINATKPKIVQEWLSERYPDVQFNVYSPSTNIPFHMPMMIEWETRREDMVEDCFRDHIYQEVKDYLHTVEPAVYGEE